MDASQLDFLGNFKFFLPQLLIFVCCIYYYAKTKSFDALLLSFGAGISLCILMMHLFILPYNWRFIEKLQGTFQLEIILSICNLLSSICFIAGFLMLILKQIDKRNRTIENDIKNIK